VEAFADDHPDAWFTHYQTWYVGVDKIFDASDHTFALHDGGRLDALVPCALIAGRRRILVSGLNEPAGPLLAARQDPVERSATWRRIDEHLSRLGSELGATTAVFKFPVLGRSGPRPPSKVDHTVLRDLGYTVQPRLFYCMNLTRDEADLWIRVSPRVRTQIRAAARRCEIREACDHRDLAALCDVYQRHAAVKGGAALLTMPAIEELLAAGRPIVLLPLLATYDGDTPGGFALCIGLGAAATVFAWGGTAESHPLQIPKLLVWRALLMLKERGFSFAEYGGSASGTPQHAGLAEFYRRLGGYVLPTAWAYRTFTV